MSVVFGNAQEKTRSKVAPRRSRVKSTPKERFTPQRIAQLDQLLAEPVSVIESPEFHVAKMRESILGPLEPGEQKGCLTAPRGTPPYLASLYDTPLLTHKAEFHLFRQMHYYRFLARDLQERLRGPAPRLADLDRLQTVLNEAVRIRNAIVQANLRLVVSIAKTMVDAGSSLDELISEGNVPLLRAVEIFDYTRGLRFSTYATWAIRHSLFRLTPRNRLRRKRFQTGIDSASFPARACEADIHIEAETGAAKESLTALLSDLDDRERVIVERRFGLGRSLRPYKFREIAGELRISTERVRQLLARALERLRSVADQVGLEWDSAAC